MIPSARFYCNGCGKQRHRADRHESGYCGSCMARGREFWRRRLSAAEIEEITGMIWGHEPVRELERVAA